MNFSSLPTLPASANFIVGAFLVGLLAGGSSAWYVKSKFVQADKVAVVEKREVALVQSVDKARGIEDANHQAKEAIKTRYVTVEKEVIKYVPETKTQGSCPDPTLSRAAVRVLDSALANADLDTSLIGDEEKQTPTAIGLRELSGKITLDAKQYYELAKDHDDLVDYVNWVTEKQKQAE